MVDNSEYKNTINDIEEQPTEFFGDYEEDFFMTFPEDNRGMGVVEVLLIMVVLIAMVAIFRTQIKDLVTGIWNSINVGAKSICS